MMDRVGQVHPDEIYQRSSTTVAAKNAVNNAENYGNSIQKSLNLEVGNSSAQSSPRSKSMSSDPIIKGILFEDFCCQKSDLQLFFFARIFVSQQGHIL